MIRHVVSWKVRDGVDNDEVVRALHSCMEQVNPAGHYEIDAHDAQIFDYPAPWSGTLIADFASEDALHQYIAHPAHVALTEMLPELLSGSAVVDFVRSA